MTVAFARGLLAVWIGIILLAVLPWGRFQDHPHWGRIDWLPFISAPVRIRDVVLNTLLYLPFGYWHLKQSGTASAWRTVGWATALSVGTEFAQIFSHGRFPSTRDVACNAFGALCGALWARR